MWILYLVSGFLIFMGIGIKYFKWYFLIAGYNTMGQQDKANIDIKGLGNIVGNFLFIVGALMIVSGIAQNSGYRLLSVVSLLVVVPLVLILIVIAQKYDHSRNEKSRKIQNRAMIGFMVIIIIGISTLFIYGSKEPTVEIKEDRIVIGGIYSTMIKKEKIKDISLEENIPKVLEKVNGFDFGYILKGIFNLEEIGTGNLFIIENKTPYVVIKSDKTFYVINHRDPNKTIELYNKLK